MKYDMDELLKNALSAKEEPDYWLNQSIIKQIEGKENTNMSKTNRRMRIPAIVMLTAAVVVAGSASVYAAWKYLTPQQVAEINKEIQALRREITLCDEVEKKAPEIRKTIEDVEQRKVEQTRESKAR